MDSYRQIYRQTDSARSSRQIGHLKLFATRNSASICDLIIFAKQCLQLMHAEFHNVLGFAGGAEPIPQVIQLVAVRWQCRSAFSARGTCVASFITCRIRNHRPSGS
jgi:hypothetical protein